MENKKSKILRTVGVGSAFVLAGGFVFANGALNMELIGQTPDPVNPGNFVYVDVKVSNAGTDSVSFADLIFEESANFQIAEGEDLVKSLGSISEKGSVTKKFKILVGNSAPVGLNTLNFKVDSNVDIEEDVEILVGTRNQGVLVESFSVDSIAPGQSSKVSLNLKNLNFNDLRNVRVNLGLDSVEDKVFSLNDGSNEKIFDLVEGGKSFSSEFDLIVSPTASSKPYLIPITVTYEDDLGNSFTKEVFGSIKVFSEPFLSLNLDSQNVYSSGKGTYTFAVANPGTSSIKGTQVEVVSGDGYKVLSGASQYLGDLNPDDFQTVQSEIFVESDTVKSLKVKTVYLNSYNEKVEKFFDVPISMYSAEEAAKLGLGTAGGSGSGSSAGTLVGAVVGALVGFFFGARREKKKHLKK